LNIDTSEYEEKPYTLKVIALDKYGNKSEKYITLIIDRTPPKVSFIDLRDGSKISKESKIVVTASDENGISKVELYVAGQKVGEKTSEPYEFNLNLPDGALKWKIKTNGDIFSTPAVADDGTIYIGSLDGYLYAYHLMGKSNGNSQLGTRFGHHLL